jgi:hypothetical protein
VAIEKWIAGASLGLFVMFSAQMITVSQFLIHPSYDVDPSSQIREFVSISGAPALILAGSSFLLSRRYGSKLNGSMIIAGGIVTIIGMIYVLNILLPKIPPAYQVDELTIAPTIFIAVAIPVMIVGALLFKTKPQPKRDYIFDR